MSYYIPVWDDSTPMNASQATVIMGNSPQLPQLKPQGFNDRQINAINKLNQLHRDYTSQQSSYQPVSGTAIDFEARNASAQEDIDQVKNAVNNARNQKQATTPKAQNVYTKPIDIKIDYEDIGEQVNKATSYGKYDPRGLTPEQLKAIGGNVSKYSPYVVGAGIAADTLFGDDRWDRKAVNLTGNAIGAAIGNRFGAPGRALGAIAGGWLSDRVADVFDDNDGKNAKPATQLLNQHLSKDPIMQIAMYEEQLRQARLQQKEMERQMMAMARIQAQAPQSSYSQSFSNTGLPTFADMVNPYENMGR